MDPRAEVMRAHAEAMNRSLKKIITSLAQLYPGDAKISRLKKRIALLVDTWPVWVVEEVGGFLYKHRETVYAEDDRFFIERDYAEEIRGARRDFGRESAEGFLYVIPKVKEAWGRLAAPEKDFYRGAIVGLLDDYIEYAAAKGGA